METEFIKKPKMTLSCYKQNYDRIHQLSIENNITVSDIIRSLIEMYDSAEPADDEPEVSVPQSPVVESIVIETPVVKPVDVPVKPKVVIKTTSPDMIPIASKDLLSKFLRRL